MNCKPGDMAIIVNSMPSGALIGRIVTVIRPAVTGEVFRALDCTLARGIGVGGHCWVVEGSSPLGWCGILYQQRPILDAFVRPISGVPVHDEQHDEVTA